MKRSRSSASAPSVSDPLSSLPASTSHELQVYASGIPYDTTEAAVRAFFAPCGEVTLIKAPTYQDTGRLRGFAHVTFASPDGVVAALALNGQHMGARYITVERAKPEGAARVGAAPGRAPKGVSTLFVRNLPYDADEDAVRAAFAKFGAVASVRLPRRSDTQATKGFGYVQFEHAFSAEAAVGAAAKGSLKVGARPAQVDYDTGAPKASFRGPDGRAFTKSNESAAVAAPKAGKRGRDEQ
jgi:nucleolin